MLQSIRKLQLDPDSAEPDHQQIARQIEQLIRTGDLKEGDRLPSTTELVRLWGLNIARIQRAMDLLVVNGLLQRFPRRGTFVAPHSLRPSIGILCGEDLLPEPAQFGRVLAFALRNEIKDLGFTPRIYDAVGVPDSDEGHRSHAELDYDLRHHPFNGFVFVSGIDIQDLPKTAGKTLSFVAFGYPKPQIDVHIDYYHFASCATRWLIDNGCQKLAYLYMPKIGVTDYDGHIRGFREVISLAGYHVPSYAMVDSARLISTTTTNFATPDRAAYVGMLRVLKQWRKENFSPDGILVSDDIAARGVAAAIQSSLPTGSEPPKMIVLATEGAEHFYALPVARYAVSAKEIAKRLMQRLTNKITNEKVSPLSECVQGRIINSFR